LVSLGAPPPPPPPHTHTRPGAPKASGSTRSRARGGGEAVAHKPGRPRDKVEGSVDVSKPNGGGERRGETLAPSSVSTDTVSKINQAKNTPLVPAQFHISCRI
jgi:hypothetical protein